MTLSVENLAFGYGSRSVLRGITCTAHAGEVVSLLGPNGAGKTTLLKCMLGLLRPQRGAVCWQGEDIRTLERTRRATIQGYVPQQASSVARISVIETVLMGRKPFFNYAPRTRDFAVVEEILAWLNLTPLGERLVPELSGGERQKVFLARALAQEPASLYLDEPTAALDIAHQIEVLDRLREIAHNQNKLVVLVMHDLTLAARYSDRLLLLCNGQIHASGTPQDVLTPANLRHVYHVEAQVAQGTCGLQVTAIRPTN